MTVWDVPARAPPGHPDADARGPARRARSPRGAARNAATGRRPEHRGSVSPGRTRPETVGIETRVTRATQRRRPEPRGSVSPGRSRPEAVGREARATGGAGRRRPVHRRPCRQNDPGPTQANRGAAARRSEATTRSRHQTRLAARPTDVLRKPTAARQRGESRLPSSLLPPGGEAALAHSALRVLPPDQPTSYASQPRRGSAARAAPRAACCRRAAKPRSRHPAQKMISPDLRRERSSWIASSRMTSASLSERRSFT